METRIGCNDLLMEHSGTLALTIYVPPAEKPLDDAIRVEETAVTFDLWCFGTEHCAVYRNVEIPQS